MAKSERLIGHHILRRPDANEFAKTLFPSDKCFAIAVSIYKTNNKYGFRVQTEDYMEGWHRNMDGLRTNVFESKKIKKAVKKFNSKKKVISKKKWVKPDEESITWANIEAMIMLELCEKEGTEWYYWKGREEMSYSILHCDSPKNPQILYDMSHGDLLESVMYALRKNRKQHFGYWALWIKIIQPKEKKKTVTHADWERLRLEYKLWKASVRKDLFSIYRWNKKSPGYKRYIKMKEVQAIHLKETMAKIEAEKNAKKE